MQYPIEITEIPHRGEPHVWVLWNERHLATCIAMSKGYDEWASDIGLTDEESLSPSLYLQWLSNDLRQLIYREAK